MYGVLWQDNIRQRYNYLKIWNLRVQKRNSKYWENLSEVLRNAYYKSKIRFIYIYGRK